MEIITNYNRLNYFKADEYSQKAKYLIKINYEFQFIHYTHKGLIARSDIGNAWKELLTIDELKNKKFNLLSDYRGGIFNFCINEVEFIEDFLNSIKNIIYGKKNAVIVDNPFDTAVSILFENKMFKRHNFYVKTFSSEIAALNFLL